MPKNYFTVFFLFLLTASALPAIGQIDRIDVKGTVYDRSQSFPMAGVSVVATSGAGTMTDSAGRYHIRLSMRDSIYFSYLGKPTSKFAVNQLNAGVPFDMSLQVDADTMATVLVWSKNYKLDSLQTRKEYKKVFDYDRGMVDNMKMKQRGAGLGVGLDFDLIFFDAAANRRMEAFQKRLEEEERDKYIDHRFSKTLVKRITGLEPPAIDTFMREYRPSYEFLQTFETDYQYYQFISESAKTFSENWKREHPDTTTSKQQPATN